MSDTNYKFIEVFNATIKHCENFCIMVRDAGLQKDACAKLQSMIVDCEKLKSQSIFAADENGANILLGFRCVTECLLSELTMWILLKEEKPDEAWDNLIRAQNAAGDAIRAHEAFAHLESQVRRLEEIERLIFPEQIFVSSGMVVRHQECSICGAEYGYCEHLAGKPYFGRFCYIVSKDFVADHMAIVKDPADKRCRITAFSVDGGERNRMTWKVEPEQSAHDGEPGASGGSQARGEVVEDGKGLRTRAMLMHLDSLRVCPRTSCLNA